MYFSGGRAPFRAGGLLIRGLRRSAARLAALRGPEGLEGPFRIRDGEAGGGQIHHDPHVMGTTLITAKTEKEADLSRS